MSVPNFVLDILTIGYGAHHIFSVQIYLFINAFYPILLLNQLIDNAIQFIDNSRLINSILERHQKINQVYDMVLKRNRMGKYLLNNAILICSPFMGLTLLFFVIECPAWIAIILSSAVVNIVGLHAFSMYFSGKMVPVSRRLYNSMHSIQVCLISRKKINSRQRLIGMKNNLKIMKMIGSQRKPLAFTFPDEQVVTGLNAFSFIGSTISLTFMVLRNKLFWDLVSV